MDKLEPIIRNRFWILAALVIPLGLWAYFSANSGLKAATEERVKAIETVKNGVSSGNVPNDKYTESMQHINEYYTNMVDKERIALWEAQKERMTWPTIVASNIPEEFMGTIQNDQTFAYKREYDNFMQKLVEYAEPVMPETRSPMGPRATTTSAKPVTWKQKVILAAELPSSQFGPLSITSDQMWNAQMDIWLTRLLLDAVRNLNQDKDSVTESIIRRIDKLDLVGGTGEPLLAGSAGGDGSGMEPGMYEGDSAMYGGGTAEAGKVASQVFFDPAQEFGPGGVGGAGGDGSGADMMGDGSGSGGTVAAEPLRYIAESEEAPFLERGFYMSVIIMQNKIPEFVTELTNSDWPVRVVRFQMGANPYFTEKVSRSGMGGEYGYESEYSSESPGYEPNYNRGAAFGGMEGGRGTGKVYGNLTSGLPEFATGALNHPDLVQLDLAGVITIYKQPAELIEKLNAEAGGEAGSDVASEGTLADPSLAPADAMPPSTSTESPEEAVVPATEAPSTEETPLGEAPAGSPATTPPVDAAPLVVE